MRWQCLTALVAEGRQEVHCDAPGTVSVWRQRVYDPALEFRAAAAYEDRLVVGQGKIPWPPLLRAIHDSGYGGAYTLEIFSRDVPDSLWQGDLSRVITDSRAGLEKAWQEAFKA